MSSARSINTPRLIVPDGRYGLNRSGRIDQDESINSRIIPNCPSVTKGCLFARPPTQTTTMSKKHCFALFLAVLLCLDTHAYPNAVELAQEALAVHCPAVNLALDPVFSSHAPHEEIRNYTLQIDAVFNGSLSMESYLLRRRSKANTLAIEGLHILPAVGGHPAQRLVRPRSIRLPWSILCLVYVSCLAM